MTLATDAILPAGPIFREWRKRSGSGKMRAFPLPRKENGMALNRQLLLKRARGGDKTAFESLVSSGLERFYGLAYQMMGNSDDASDVLQEAMIKAYRAIGSFRQEADFMTWFGRIIRNTALDELKKASRKHEEATDILPETLGPGLEGLTEQKELQEILGKAIATLSDKLREPLILYDIEGFSYEEIAGLLEINQGTVKSRLNRAREALRQQLRTQFSKLAGYLPDGMLKGGSNVLP